ncbi:MAG: metallophosphoesterase [Planctomycetia bacterium]|nr:metallophosphoesterase [Planctomycetia bacterium]
MSTTSEPTDDRPADRAAGGHAVALAAPRKVTRRQWLRRTTWGAYAAALGVIVETFFIEPHWLEIVRRDLPIRNLPVHWQGRTLAQISDIHVGRQVSDSFLIGAFERVAAIGADVVALTGDFVTCGRRDSSVPIQQAVDVFAHLPRGKIATLGILGNHDYGPNWSDRFIAARVETVLSDAGVKMLRNESIGLDGLTIVGLDDLLANRCNGNAGFAGTSQHTARLVLCHNPDAADRDIWNGYEGWILSGHTHGGQCKPPFFPPPALPVANRRYTAGEFELQGNRRMYINRGLGHLLPVRFNCRPEITIFQLTAG